MSHSPMTSPTTQGWVYAFKASFIEIYNETIRDLLNDADEGIKHDIRKVSDKTDDIYITDLTEVYHRPYRGISSTLPRYIIRDDYR